LECNILADGKVSMTSISFALSAAAAHGDEKSAVLIKTDADIGEAIIEVFYYLIETLCSLTGSNFD
jgi:hypothetical protein